MWSSQEEEVLLLAFRQERQILSFIKWGFTDQIFCKGSGQPVETGNPVVNSF